MSGVIKRRGDEGQRGKERWRTERGEQGKEEEEREMGTERKKERSGDRNELGSLLLQTGYCPRTFFIT